MEPLSKLFLLFILCSVGQIILYQIGTQYLSGYKVSITRCTGNAAIHPASKPRKHKAPLPAIADRGALLHCLAYPFGAWTRIKLSRDLLSTSIRKRQINAAGESTEFIEMLLATIKASLMDAIKMSDVAADKAALRWRSIEHFLDPHGFIMNSDVRALCGVPAAMANRILARLVKEEKLIKCRTGGH